MRNLIIIAAVLISLVAVGCGGSEDGGSEAATETVTVETEAPAQESTPEAPAETEPAPKPKPRKITVPNVVGMNHQKAQDTMQAKGLYTLQEEDCEGLDRFLVLDSNWVVVRQTPKAGTRVSKDRPITLCSRKYTD